ncbi:hypothetical protein SynA1825c_00075 [Synechococcus sp. A18-25c]|nr:hypothetical protein SynA1825c_00075 [Synechococcus sp. A18-25c]
MRCINNALILPAHAVGEWIDLISAGCPAFLCCPPPFAAA